MMALMKSFLHDFGDSSPLSLKRLQAALMYVLMVLDLMDVPDMVFPWMREIV